MSTVGLVLQRFREHFTHIHTHVHTHTPSVLIAGLNVVSFASCWSILMPSATPAALAAPRAVTSGISGLTAQNTHIRKIRLLVTNCDVMWCEVRWYRVLHFTRMTSGVTWVVLCCYLDDVMSHCVTWLLTNVKSYNIRLKLHKHFVLCHSPVNTQSARGNT